MFPFYDDRVEARRQAILRLVCAGFIGGATGSLAYNAVALAIELFFLPPMRISGEPYLSYGQEAGMMMCVAGLLGASVGVSFVIARPWGGFIMSAAGALVGCFAVTVWVYSNRRYGVDPSDLILYPPIFIGASLAFFSGLLLYSYRVVRGYRLLAEQKCLPLESQASAPKKSAQTVSRSI